MKTGEKIKEARIAFGMKQTELAYAASMYQSQLSNYEKCLYIPTKTVLCRIADVLGVQVESLMGDDIRERKREYTMEEKHGRPWKDAKPSCCYKCGRRKPGCHDVETCPDWAKEVEKRRADKEARENGRAVERTYISRRRVL